MNEISSIKKGILESLKLVKPKTALHDDFLYMMFDGLYWVAKEKDVYVLYECVDDQYTEIERSPLLESIMYFAYGSVCFLLGIDYEHQHNIKRT